MRRVSPTSSQRDAVTKPMLSWILQHLDFNQAHHRVVGGATVLGYFFLLRGAEYLAVNGRRKRYALQVKNVSVRDARGLPTIQANQAHSVELHLRGHTTDQDGHGTTRYLRRSGHPRLCTVLAAMLLIHNAGALGLEPHDPLCSLSTSRMLTTSLVTQVLRHAAAANGKNPSLFSCHSLRRGGATALLASGIDSTVVMLHGRWRSDVFQRYTRYTEDTGAHLASRMASGAQGRVRDEYIAEE